MKEFCLGFAFPTVELSREEVVLIRKEKPDFQKGKLNGIGGKVENGETGVGAMVREFREETGVDTLAEEWKHVCTFIIEDCHIHVFTSNHCRFGACRTMEEEQIMIRQVSSLWSYYKMENLGWLVPMCLTALQNPGCFHPLLVEDYPE